MEIADSSKACTALLLVGVLVGTDPVFAEKTVAQGKLHLECPRASWAGGQHCSAFALALGCLGVFLAVNAAAVPDVFLCTRLSVLWCLRLTGFFLFSY